MIGKTYVVLFALISLLVIGVGAVLYSSTALFSGSSTQAPVVEGGIIDELRNITQTLRVSTLSLPPTEFYGPTFSSSSSGLTLEAALSSPSVRVNETLWVKGTLVGPNAWSVGMVRFTVINSGGQKVYDVYTWLPHRTLAPEENSPQEYGFYLQWEARRSETAENVEVTPGSYSFVIGTGVEGGEPTIRGTIGVIDRSTNWISASDLAIRILYNPDGFQIPLHVTLLPNGTVDQSCAVPPNYAIHIRSLKGGCLQSLYLEGPGYQRNATVGSPLDSGGVTLFPVMPKVWKAGDTIEVVVSISLDIQGPSTTLELDNIKVEQTSNADPLP